MSQIWFVNNLVLIILKTISRWNCFGRIPGMWAGRKRLPTGGCCFTVPKSVWSGWEYSREKIWWPTQEIFLTRRWREADWEFSASLRKWSFGLTLFIVAIVSRPLVLHLNCFYTNQSLQIMCQSQFIESCHQGCSKTLILMSLFPHAGGRRRKSIGVSSSTSI